MTSFEESWGFPAELKQALGASGYDINPTPDCFRSGRPKFECVFFTGAGHNRLVIERREAMSLISKKTGKPYHVVSRKPEAAGQGGLYTLDDVLVA